MYLIESRAARLWKSKEERLQIHEARVAGIMRSHFADEARRVVVAAKYAYYADEELHAAAYKVIEVNIRANNIARRIKTAQAPGSKILKRKLDRALGTTAQSAARSLSIGMRFEFPGFSKRTTAFLETYVPKFADSIDATSRQRILGVVLEGIKNGDKLPTIARSIRLAYDKFKRSRPDLIAKTLTSIVAAQAEYDLIEDMPKSARDAIRLTWITSRDDRVRDLHQIDGETIRFGEEFSNGLRFPKDPEGEPENIINCRCYLLYQLAKVA